MSNLRNKLRRSALSDPNFEDIEVVIDDVDDDGNPTQTVETIRLVQIGFGARAEMLASLNHLLTPEQVDALQSRDGGDEEPDAQEILSDVPLMTFSVLQVALCARDPATGERLFSTEDVPALMDSPAPWLTELLVPTLRVNGHLDADPDEGPELSGNAVA